jgi:hypothetical protein
MIVIAGLSLAAQVFSFGRDVIWLAARSRR